MKRAHRTAPTPRLVLVLALLAAGCTSEELVRLVNDRHDRRPIDESERAVCPRDSFWEMSRER